MACGRPVVASDLDVLHEVLGPLGHFAPIGDAEKFAEQLAVVGALPDGERTAHAQALRQRAIERFDPRQTTDRLLRVYEYLRAEAR